MDPQPAESDAPRRVSAAIACYGIGIYQILSAADGFHRARPLLAFPSGVSGLEIGFTFLFLLLSFAAGLGLVLHHRWGRRLTLWNQGLQIIGIANPWITFIAQFMLSFRLYGSAVPIDDPHYNWSSTSGFSVEYGSNLHFALGTSHPEFPGYHLALNLFAIALFVAAWRIPGARQPQAGHS